MDVAPADPAGAQTEDAFLGGRLRILQPRIGYRAGSDPVMLAAACPARPGEQVLELGCGVGVAALCLGRRVGELVLAGVERQATYAALAGENAARNGIALELAVADIAALPGTLRERSFDHVIANPPYFAPGTGTPASDPGRAEALAEETPLATWVEVAARRLRPGGHLTLIQDVARLPDVLAALDGRLGSVAVRPLQPREGRAARRFILRARKGGRAAFRLAPPLILHTGLAHDGDRDSYAPEAAAILREGAPLDV